MNTNPPPSLMDTAYISITPAHDGGDQLPLVLEEMINMNSDSSYVALSNPSHGLLRIDYDDIQDSFDVAALLVSLLVENGITSFDFTYSDSRSSSYDSY